MLIFRAEVEPFDRPEHMKYSSQFLEYSPFLVRLSALFPLKLRMPSVVQRRYG